ncbi:hypothetical protein JOF34_000079 [Microbacterium amylolyticum]|uniref:Uncharacterized protein n=1 Tax=Microbacterium amylolyticum TaxID=936337 RepID=A0ABS4ZDX8_9MICO|nr:hypothetical protein [Microbacterium amylolyticum]
MFSLSLWEPHYVGANYLGNTYEARSGLSGTDCVA